MKKYFKYLNGLKESGEVNMFGALPYLIQEFGISRDKAKEVLFAWMKQYGKEK